MGKHILPSRLKGLSLAVAQVVAVSGGAVSVAQAGVAAAPSVGNAYVLGAGQTATSQVLQQDWGAGEVSVTLEAGAAVDVSGYFGAVAVSGGVITLEAGASVEAENYEVVGIYAGGKGGKGGADSVAITLNSDTSVTASAGDDSDTSATAIEVEDLKEVTITLGAGSSVSATATGDDFADAYAIDATASDYDDDGYGASITLDANSATITSSATATTYGADAEGVTAYAYSEYDDASTTVDLDSSTLTVTANGETDASAEGIDAESDAEGYYGGGAASTTVTLNATTATITSTSNGSAEADGIDAYSDSSGYGEGSDGTSVVSLTGSTLTVRATGDYANVEAIEAYAGGESSATATVTLTDTSVTAEATANDGRAFATGVYAESYSEFDSEASITLNGGSVAVTANATSYSESSDAGAVGLEVQAYGEYGGDASITLNGGSVTVGATAQTYGEGDSFAYARGLEAEARGDEDDSSAIVTLNGGSVSVSAESSKYAVAIGIEASADGDAGSVAMVDLDSATVSSIANAGDSLGVAVGIGVYARGGSQAIVDLSDSSVSADSGKYAVGIAAYDRSGYGSAVTLNSSQVTANTDDGHSFGVRANGYGAAIELNNSHITATADDGYSYGVEANGYGATVTLDSSSSIEADAAVTAYYGHVDNAGTIRGIVKAQTVDNSGYMFGHVLATNSLTVRTGGVVAGTADVGTLLVESGGVLEAIMTDETDPAFPHFTATDATLEDGAIVRINATSELFAPEVDGLDYLILEADTLTANQELLDLQYSGLVSVSWADCGDDSVCVNVRAADFEQLATNDGSATNGVSAAGAAQSVLEDNAGTDVGDEFLALMEKVSDNGDWEDLDAPARSEALMASNDAERVVSRYVQRLLQSGRSSGEEFQPARGLWIQALHSSGEQDQVKDASGYEIDTTGMALGYDTELQPGLTVGGALSYAYAEVDVDDSADRVETDTYMATLYGEYKSGAWFANGVLTYGQGDNEGKRHVSGEVASSDYDSELLSLRFQAGRSFASEAGWLIQPRAELSYNRVDIDSYDEKGTLLALSIDSQRYETVTVGAGVELSKNFLFNSGILTPYLDLAVYRDLSNDQIQSTNSFVIGGDSFVTVGADVEKTNISATVGASWLFSDSHTVRAAYEYYGNSDFDSDSWMMRYSYDF